MAGRGDGITMSPATVQRMLTEMVLKPPRVRSWLTRPDPECEPTMDEIVKLELAPPRHSRRLGRDKKTSSQALERCYPRLPRRPGQLERRAFESIRHGVVDLCAAFDVRTGQVCGPCSTHPSPVEWRHLRRGLRARAPDRRWHLMLDHASDHPQPAVLAWCAAQRPKITRHWVPDHGSWRNQVESWGSILSRTGLRRARVGSPRKLRSVLHGLIDTWNAHFAHPFQGTYTGKPLAGSPQQFDLAAA
jgi:hypothetical protein